MKKWPILVTGIVLVFLLVGYYAFGMMNSGGNSFYGSMMGNGEGSMMRNGQGSMMGGNNQNVQMISSSNAKKQIDITLKNAQINKQKNSITYTGDKVHIALLGGPEEADGKFVVGGLVNPTLHVPKNAHVVLELMNADEGMPHGVEITNAAPPYGQMSMMQGGILNGAFISPIPAAQNDQYPFSQTDSFQVNQSGQFYYICQYPGHAAKGMYGKIIFE